MKNFKKTLALLAALTIVGTAFAACGETDGGSGTTTTPASTTTAGDEETTAAGGNEGADIKLPTDGDQFTVMSWNDEFPDMVNDYYIKDNPLPSGVEYNKVAHGVGGGEASAKYDTYFLSGEDIDIYCLEADFALKFLEGQDSAPLSDVGLTEADFADNYGYTLEIGKVGSDLKAVSFQAAPGGWAYRTDLAESLLGVKTPEEMQAKVKDWATFKETAAEVAEASGKKTAMTATLGGMWQTFSSARKDGWITGDMQLNVTDDVTNFMEMAKEYHDNKWATDLGQWSDEWNAFGKSDITLGAFASTWGVKDTGTPEDAANGFLTNAAGKETESYGKWALVEGPQSYFWGGTWLAVSPNSDNADLVKATLEYFCKDAASMKKYAEATGDFVNNKKVMDELVAAK
ncbi:MAG: carbohydrate ABC transporter substrate-binding protein, partial [Oscillospiraceae bacterium]|nr:carbohydrate ABC transporter substrate-binding protein [Oscillospiraceae bacterium]